jgi:tetratricopeptide (TPR) repeat protein
MKFRNGKGNCKVTAAALVGLLALGLVGCGRTEAVSEPGPQPAEILRPRQPADRNSTIGFLEDRLKNDPDDFVALNKLGGAYLQRLRETGDVAYLDLALRAAGSSLTVLPAEKNKGGLAIRAQAKFSSHDFAGARDDATRLVVLEPAKGYPYQILGDALLELGDYQQADDAYRKMQELGGVSDQARIGMEQRLGRRAFLSGDLKKSGELYGNALKLALKPPGAMPETLGWCYWQAGEAAFKTGDYATAEKQYRLSLDTFPNYPQAVASLGRSRAAQGDMAGAIEQFETVVRRLPDPVFVAELGDLYQLAGRPDDAARQYTLVEQIARLTALSGRLYNRQLALFYADHDMKPDEAYRMAVGEYENRKDVYGADAVAWTAFKAGKMPEAQAAMKEAMRLGTRDARLFYHAGMIAGSLGDRDQSRRLLEAALKLNPAFDQLQAQKARTQLSQN